MTTNYQMNLSIRNLAWLLTRVACTLALAVAGTTAFAATFTIDQFSDTPENRIDNNNPANTYTSPSVWGGERKAELTFPTTPTPAVANFNGTTNVDPFLNDRFDFNNLLTGEADVELKYKSQALTGTDYKVVLDIVRLDFGNVADYNITLEVGAFANPADSYDYNLAFASDSQTLMVGVDGVAQGPPNSYLLSFDLSDNAFSNVHAALAGGSNFAFRFLFDSDEGADITLESILLETIPGGPGVVPEPSTWALSSMALLGLCFGGYRRLRKGGRQKLEGRS